MTATDSNATVESLDGSDTALTDAGDMEDGFQGDLAVGGTMIKTQVTPEDTTAATQTYQVMLTRAAATTCTDENAIWCTTLTVGT